MIDYGIEFLPLKTELREAHTCVTQLWYADDAGNEGKFTHILAHLRDLHARGTPKGYFPKMTKIILVVAPRNVSQA